MYAFTTTTLVSAADASSFIQGKCANKFSHQKAIHSSQSPTTLLNKKSFSLKFKTKKETLFSSNGRVYAAPCCSIAIPRKAKVPPTVVVFGVTGGVGQLVSIKLLKRGYSVRLVARNMPKAQSIFAQQIDQMLTRDPGANYLDCIEVVEADTRNYNSDLRKAVSGIQTVICATGTTAFPSARWDSDRQNNPSAVDDLGVKNLIRAYTEESLTNGNGGGVGRFVLVSSIGVQRMRKFPFFIINLFGALSSKFNGEQALRESKIPYTILRAGQLAGDPRTSYDLNTLRRATISENKKGVKIDQGDRAFGATDRHVIAEACVQVINIKSTRNQEYEIFSAAEPVLSDDDNLWEKAFDELTLS